MPSGVGDVLTFQDLLELFKQSGVALDSFLSVSYLDMALVLLCSLLIGLFIHWVYRVTFRGVVYSYNYNVSYVLMTIITALVIMTISSNLVLSLGMVGALSIVRFRTAVKDPLDIVYMFWAIAAGITAGAKLYPVALVGSAFIGLVLFWVSRKKIRHQPFLLIVRYTEEAADAVRERLAKLPYTLKGKTVRKDYIELTAELRLRDDNTAFLSDLAAIDGVVDASLVNYRGDYAQ